MGICGLLWLSFFIYPILRRTISAICRLLLFLACVVVVAAFAAQLIRIIHASTRKQQNARTTAESVGAGRWRRCLVLKIFVMWAAAPARNRARKVAVMGASGSVVGIGPH